MFLKVENLVKEKYRPMTSLVLEKITILGVGFQN